MPKLCSSVALDPSETLMPPFFSHLAAGGRKRARRVKNHHTWDNSAGPQDLWLNGILVGWMIVIADHKLLDMLSTNQHALVAQS